MDEQVLNVTEPIIRVLMIIFIVMGAIINFISWFRRHLVSYLLHVELMFLLIHRMVPYDYGDFTLEAISIYTIFIFIMFNWHSSIHILTTMLALMVVIFAELPLISKEKWQDEEILEKVLAVLINLIALLSVKMIFLERKENRKLFQHVIGENLNLIDKMQEGLIVLSEADRNLVFASIPAVHLLK